MDRRRFLVAGSGLATLAGASASVAGAASAGAATAPKLTPTVFDFGAAGDGHTDDSGAFSRALQHAAASGIMVIVPAGTYAIAKTVTYKSEGNVGRGWGLICEGATLLSQIEGDRDVVSLSSNHIVRYFKLIGSLSIVGNGRDGNGLHIAALGNPQSFYNFLIDGLSVERCGGHGGLIEGNVFEFTVANSYFQDMRHNGFTLAHSHKGIVSTVNIMNCFFNQNGQYGLATTNFDEKYGGPTDVRVYGGYARENQGFGFYYNNGTRQASLIQVGFENNCRGLKPGDPNGAHVYGLGSMRMKDCAGYNQTGGATYLLRGWLQGLTQLDGCTQGAGAAMEATGKSRLVQVNGPRGSHVYMVGCAGGVDVVGGSGVTWEAKNCIGPSPSGNLQMAGTLNGTA